MDLQKYFKPKQVQILLVAALAYVGLQFLINGTFELDTTLAYCFIAVLLGNILKLKHMKAAHFALLSVLIPTIYNILFSVLGFFTFTIVILTIVIIGLQQAVITYIISKLFGVK